MTQYAKLRVCASCEWIFRDSPVCPKCGFSHYGARSVYGNKCYKYEKTQQPWLDRKFAECINILEEEIANSQLIE